MKTVYICDLIGPALDWAVADCEGALAPLGNLHRIGLQLFIGVGGDLGEPGQWVLYRPSTDWGQAGPIIERENIEHSGSVGQPKHAQIYMGGYKWVDGHGPTFLVAAMRAYCISKKGPSVSIPADFCP